MVRIAASPIVFTLTCPNLAGYMFPCFIICAPELLLYDAETPIVSSTPLCPSPTPPRSRRRESVTKKTINWAHSLRLAPKLHTAASQVYLSTIYRITITTIKTRGPDKVRPYTCPLLFIIKWCQRNQCS